MSGLSLADAGQAVRAAVWNVPAHQVGYAVCDAVRIISNYSRHHNYSCLYIHRSNVYTYVCVNIYTQYIYSLAVWLDNKYIITGKQNNTLCKYITVAVFFANPMSLLRRSRLEHRSQSPLASLQTSPVRTASLRLTRSPSTCPPTPSTTTPASTPSTTPKHTVHFVDPVLVKDGVIVTKVDEQIEQKVRRFAVGSRRRPPNLFTAYSTRPNLCI